MTGLRFSIFALCGAALFAAPHGEPQADTRTVFTSTRTITATHRSPDGTFWVGTRGGVRRRDALTGVWQTFTREHGLPVHEVRAFAETNGVTVAVFADGTAAKYAGDSWKTCAAVPPPASKIAQSEAVPPATGEPADHNAQAITFFGGAMYVSTLRDGLVVRGAGGDWAQLLPPTVSSDAPRQMLTFQNALYVRHGSGAVDRFDGETWAKNVWATDLPRKQVSAFATDGNRVFAAQWGGVSVYDGKKWAHFLREPTLQGVPIVALLPVGDTLYLGTQGRGLAEMDTATGRVRRFWNEAHGLCDDWITALSQSGDTLYAGTFVGGLAIRAKNAPRFTVATETEGENVTDLLPLAGGGVVAATRFGAKIVDAPGATLPPLVTGRTVEAQCVARSPTGETWIGTRTGLYRFGR